MPTPAHQTTASSPAATRTAPCNEKASKSAHSGPFTNDRYLVCHEVDGHSVIEVTPTGEVVWQVTQDERNSNRLA